MSKAKRIKALKKKKLNQKERDFLKFINQEEPHYFITTVPGIGPVDVTDTILERRTA